jgi:hypothetical protein
MKLYSIALLITAVTADQADIDRMTNDIVNDITSDTNQAQADRAAEIAEQKRLAQIEADKAWQRKVKIATVDNLVE